MMAILSVSMPSVPWHKGREDGESDTDFVNRQTNLLRFYLGLLVLAQDAERIWTWAVAVLNAASGNERVNRIAVFAVHTFMEMAGFFMAKRFGKEFGKLLTYFVTFTSHTLF